MNESNILIKLPAESPCVPVAKLVAGRFYRSPLVKFEHAVIWLAVKDANNDTMLVSLKGATVLPPQIDEYVEVRMVRGVEVSK